MQLAATWVMGTPPPALEREPVQADERDALTALVARVREGDPTAFERLYHATRDDVYAVLFKLLGPSPELDDLFQEAWIQLIGAIRRFRGESRFSTFAWRVCANVALKHLRTRRRRPEDLVNELPELPAVSGTPHDLAQAKESAALVHAALELLSPKKRVVFVYAELMEMRLEEIAQAVDAPLNTVRSRLLNARAEFPRALAEVQRLHRSRRPVHGGA
ncbi:MAG: sigma-70 family RNA polymerase sigma factor [Myxococcaceae bacterium]|nr:sigma-70 family RNA polymerase sigma factor [Myxococcaceae bacterium]